MRRWVLPIGWGVLTIVTLSLGARLGPVWVLDEPAAVVNGQPVTKGEVLDRLLADFGDETLKQLITLKLLEQEAAAAGITLNEDEVSDQVRQLESQRELLRKQLARPVLSDLTLRDEARKLLLLRKLVAEKMPVSDQELKEFYSRHFIRYNQPETVTIREIVVFSRTEAQNIYLRLQRTRPGDLAAEFDRLAKERSVVPGSEGTFTYTELPEQMVQALKKARVNEILPPILVKILNQDTFRIVWLRNRVPAKTNPFEKIKDTVRQDYALERIALLGPELIAKLWKKADIKYQSPFSGVSTN
ncbi:MAG: peptidyl-prolyl cis-trans isomerase [Armatimonadetes bacterium]|nr:peptidyl-prolyl cis-trans isomerase [Armatimonadota bacterium]MDW8121666.1 peptidyl-prolyl cis-trans isomerase [Armatimonadota bacterium]